MGRIKLVLYCTWGDRPRTACCNISRYLAEKVDEENVQLAAERRDDTNVAVEHETDPLPQQSRVDHDGVDGRQSAEQEARRRLAEHRVLENDHGQRVTDRCQHEQYGRSVGEDRHAALVLPQRRRIDNSCCCGRLVKRCRGERFAGVIFDGFLRICRVPSPRLRSERVIPIVDRCCSR